MREKVIIYTITIVISIAIVLTLGVPHHIGEVKAVELAREYFNYRMDVSTLTIETYNVRREYTQANVDDYTSYSYIQKESKDQVDLFSKIYDYWNPNFKCYSITFNVVMDSWNESQFTINVDAYTGFVFDGMEGIAWQR